MLLVQRRVVVGHAQRGQAQEHDARVRIAAVERRAVHLAVAAPALQERAALVAHALGAKRILHAMEKNCTNHMHPCLCNSPAVIAALVTFALAAEGILHAMATLTWRSAFHAATPNQTNLRAWKACISKTLTSNPHIQTPSQMGMRAWKACSGVATRAGRP